MFIRQVVDEKLAQYAYLIGCQQTGEALVVDPERDVDRYLALAAEHDLRIVAAVETHIHADFLSGVRQLAASIPGLKVYLSAEGGPEWQYEWPHVDAGITPVWLRDGDVFSIGRVELRALHTPGHTPEHLSFTVVDRGGGADTPIALVSGDFVFSNDVGRPDLLESALGIRGVMDASARQLFDSLMKVESLTDFAQIWPGHGAGSGCGKALGAVPITTVGYERQVSPAFKKAREGEQAFVSYILADQPEPPQYFADMKRLNRVGPRLLERLPAPVRLDAGDMRAGDQPPDAQYIDTRSDRSAFLRHHLRGAIYAPSGKTFPTLVGSMVDRSREVVLIIEEEQLAAAVRDLVRIGYDEIIGWVPPQALEDPAIGADAIQAAESISFEEMDSRRRARGVHVLDVRGSAEYRQRHVTDAVNIPHTRLRARAGELSKEATYLVHCGSGARAAAAVSLLQSLGFHVVHVDGDFSSWSEDTAHAAAAVRR